MRQLLDATGAGNGRAAAAWPPASPTPTSKTAGPAAADAGEEGRAARSGRVRVPLGRRLSRCSSGTRRRSATSSMHHPFTSPHDDDLAQARHRAWDGAGQGVRPGAERQRDRRRQHPYPRRRRCRAGSSRCSTSAPRRRSCDSASSSRRSSTARRRTAASRSAWTASCAHAGERELDPRGHRVPEDGHGRRPDVGRAVAGRSEAAARSCTCRSAST